MEYLMCAIGGAFFPVIYGWYRDYQIEQLEKKISNADECHDKEVQEFYDELINRGYGEFEYKHIAKPNKAICEVERSFNWLKENAVIKNILDKRKKESN